MRTATPIEGAIGWQFLIFKSLSREEPNPQKDNIRKSVKASSLIYFLSIGPIWALFLEFDLPQSEPSHFEEDPTVAKAGDVGVSVSAVFVADRYVPNF